MLLVAAVARAQAVRSWDAASGLAENHVSYIESDGGELWLSHGRNWPLSVLDGFEVRQVRLPPGSEEVFQVGFSDLWVLHPQGLLYQDRAPGQDRADGADQAEQWRRIPIAEVAASAVDHRLGMRILAAAKGRAWLLLRDRLLLVDAASRTATVQLDRDAQGLSSMHALALDQGARALWIGMSNGVAYVPVSADGTLTGEPRRTRLPARLEGKIRWLSPGRPGEVFATLFAPGVRSRTVLRFDELGVEELVTTRSSSAFAWRGREGHTWTLDGPRLESTDDAGRTNALSHPVEYEVNDIHGDGDGALWLATTQGLLRVGGLPWSVERHPLAWGRRFSSGAPAPDGSTYFAAARALLRLDQGDWTAFPFPAGRETYPLLSRGTVPLRDGSVLVRVRNPNFLLRLDPRTGTYRELRHPRGRRFRALQPQPDGTAWVNTSSPDDRFSQSLEIFDGSRWTTVLDRPGEWGVGRIKSFWSDPDGALWIGGTTGLGRLDAGEFEVWTGNETGSFPGAFVVYRDRDGRLLVGTRTGLREFRDGEWSPVDENLGKVRSIAEDSDGRLWIAGDTGVHFEQEGLWIGLDEPEGLPSKLASALVLDADRRLWAATAQGLARYDGRQDRVAPRVRLDEAYDVADFAPEHPVRFGFTASDRQRQTPANRILFSFRLDDEPWTPPRAQPSFYRERLPSGPHRLEARAIDRNGNVGVTAAPVEFAVALPWYRTGLFLLTAGIGIALVVALSVALTLSFRRKTRLVEELAARDQVLERQVAERTRQLAQERDRANEAARLKSEFLANMSHEIRTPMNVVIGMTELMLSGDPNDKDRRYLQSVLSSAESLLTIINDILDFSKIEAGKLHIESTPFALGEALVEVHHAFLDRAQEKSLDLRLDLSSNVLDTVVGDPTRVRQVLINLVGNAVKFTDAGFVEIAARTIAADDERQEVEFRVSDSGIGIPEASQAEIFEAFSQADGSTTRRFGGTGLGLAICRQLVTLMGGSLGLKSTQGEGSVFWFTVPFARKPESVGRTSRESLGESSREPADESAGESLTRLGSAVAPRTSADGRDVLLVEDLPENQELVVAMLERIGCRVRIASNGLEGLKEWGKRRPDVVLMDLQMPEMGGLEATRILREREAAAAAHTPIIALTAHAVKGDRERCLAAGMDDFLAKPVRMADLYAALDRVTESATPSGGDA